MTPLALSLALACGLAWSLLDVARKQLGERIPATTTVVALHLAQAPLFAAWAMYQPALEPGYLVPGVVLLFINCASNVLFVVAVSISPLSSTIPFLALTPVFTVLSGLVVLGEGITVPQGLGAHFVCVHIPYPRAWRRILYIFSHRILRPGRADTG